MRFRSAPPIFAFTSLGKHRIHAFVMIKNIFFFLTISFWAAFIGSVTYACDPLGCLMGGHKQDTLILGEVESAPDDMDNQQAIKIIFIFPQSHISTLKKGDIINVRDLVNAMNLLSEEEKSRTIGVGLKYLMSLNKEDNFYVPAWGIYEITGTTFSDAKLVKNKSIDDRALQILINSGGTERDFGFDYSGLKPTLFVKPRL